MKHQDELSNIYNQRTTSNNLIPTLLHLLTEHPHMNPGAQHAAHVATQPTMHPTLTQQLGGLLQQQPSYPQQHAHPSNLQVRRA